MQDNSIVGLCAHVRRLGSIVFKKQIGAFDWATKQEKTESNRSQSAFLIFKCLETH